MKKAVAAAVIAIAAGPVLLLLLLSIARAWYWPALVPRSWSLRAWLYVFSPDAEVLRAMWTSAGLAVCVGCVSVLLAVPAARALAMHVFPGRRMVILLLALPLIAPPLASTMGLHRVFLSLRLTDTWIGVALCHLPPALPYAVLALAASFRRLDTDYELQARALGAGTTQVWRYVTLPLIAPGLAVAFSFAFLVSWSQYLLTLLIGGGRVLTLPMELVGFQRGGDEGIAAALSLVFLLPAVAVMTVVGRRA